MHTTTWNQTNSIRAHTCSYTYRRGVAVHIAGPYECILLRSGQAQSYHMCKEDNEGNYKWWWNGDNTPISCSKSSYIQSFFSFVSWNIFIQFFIIVLFFYFIVDSMFIHVFLYLYKLLHKRFITISPLIKPSHSLLDKYSSNEHTWKFGHRIFCL